MDVKIWKADTAKIRKGFMCVMIASVLMGLLSIFVTLNILPAHIGLFAALGLEVMAIIAYVFYFVGITKMAKHLDGEDKASFRVIRNAIIVNLIAIFLGVLAGLLVNVSLLVGVVGGFLSALLGLASLVLTMLAFEDLKTSLTFPKMARKGAKLIFASLVIMLIFTIISFIPYAAIIGGAVCIIVWVLQAVGWTKIANADPEDTRIADFRKLKA